eukprot:1141229-Pelagomonas_calceolata.AAC.2
MHTLPHTHLADGPHHRHLPWALCVHLHRGHELLPHLHVALLPGRGQPHSWLAAALYVHNPPQKVCNMLCAKDHGLIACSTAARRQAAALVTRHRPALTQTPKRHTECCVCGSVNESQLVPLPGEGQLHLWLATALHSHKPNSMQHVRNFAHGFVSCSAAAWRGAAALAVPHHPTLT